MNKRLVLRLLGAILLIEALAMAPSLAISLLYGDGDALALLSSMALLAALGFPAWRFARPREQNLRAREGFLVVALLGAAQRLWRAALCDLRPDSQLYRRLFRGGIRLYHHGRHVDGQL